MNHRIADRGVTVGYEPREGEPVADIVFVHGLQGHPCRTWATTNSCSPSATGSLSLSSLRNMISRLVTKSLHNEAPSVAGDLGPEDEGKQPSSSDHQFVLWPVDLLPGECPKSRVLLYGYDTKVTRLTAGAPDRGSTFSHGKDLLFALGRARTPGRPLIFVAHSLGGIVVKEMLSSSENSGEPGLKDIVESTAAVVFLGTPHRGSPELVSLAEWARLVVKSLRFESSWAIMDALGLKTTDLERTQEAFSRLWQTHGFQVKTFQEGMGLTGFKLGNAGNKVVPIHSSLIGDGRERAETLWANHKEMCRFAGSDDPNYRRVVGELESVYRSILEPGPAAGPRVSAHADGPALPRGPSAHGKTQDSRDGLSDTQRACLRALFFPSMTARYHEVDAPAEGTCCWIFESRGPGDLALKSPEFRNWVTGEHKHTHGGFLLIRGKPGSGKSVLMKEAHRRISAGEINSLLPSRTQGGLGSYCTAAVFFNAKKGHNLARSRVGFFRSVLYQLLPHHPAYFEELSKRWRESLHDWEQGTPMQEAELKRALQAMFKRKSGRKSYIFVDALDECASENDTRYIFSFCRQMARSAQDIGVSLSICASTRHFPNVSIGGDSQITLDDCNRPDVRSYVESKIHEKIFTKQTRLYLIAVIIRKSSGVFLWAVLVVDDVIKMSDEGRNMEYIVKHLTELPWQLDELYTDILASMGEEECRLATSLFHWAILATKPLRVREWHHILAFIKKPAPLSLREWRLSDGFTEDDEQLIRRIRHISRGLLEVRSYEDEAGNDAPEAMSTRAGAGSLTLGSGETRVVQVIHESVREFFLRGSGTGRGSFGEDGHISIFTTCLDYLNIAELDSLVHARMEVCSSTQSKCGTDRDSESVATDGALDTTLLLDSLKASEETMPCMDVIEWLGKIQTPADQHNDHQPSHADPLPSADEHTHVLEDYPALLSYATCELFRHARLVIYYNADATPVIRRLLKPMVWDRWVALREDVPQDTNMLNYLHSIHLSGWARDVGKRGSAGSLQVPGPEMMQRPRRQESVASFSSAGSSHPGSVASDFVQD